MKGKQVRVVHIARRSRRERFIDGVLHFQCKRCKRFLDASKYWTNYSWSPTPTPKCKECSSVNAYTYKGKTPAEILKMIKKNRDERS